MAQACADHVQDQGPKGLLNHIGSDGSDNGTRLSRYGTWHGSASENITYGPRSTGEEIVMQLYIDDGVPDRGHRINLMNRDIYMTGNFSGPHEAYGYMSCMTYATSYEPKQN